ncbi:MAG: substrate-binding domain-containing protein [Pseudodesulfovibrio sp.]|jgi:tungstate transport system substrate-binding protein|uniref:Tungstate transport system substrate-binding protein n=1 Tax=Pseudodesulfovibrio indicus TaxID=1716143 RepID=A0A126QNT4_9BACT|nr:substrate-binding domain-containing protein [Pseudodesulfovibrio indicus]AMK11581.1 tungsten ABC transporter substrate-binding protein [Pseudodesulfovibrio indicus]TDT89988.1 tungstate transport system substrate-binding protein [Pseudodesulfovibrio indicus]
MKRILLIALSAILVLSLAIPAMASETLMMATTTSTANTGLLDELIVPKFLKDTGIEIKFIAVGTGKALAMAENCDVDVVLVHAPASEKAYVDKGVLIDRKELMYNDFVIIGPAADPAGVKGMNVAEALKTIGQKQAVFASRGDNSGTHKKELSLWKAAGMPVPEKDAWYIQTGQGMLPTINIANEKNGYTMTDRGTYIKYADTKGGNPPLVVLVEGDKVLFNQYSALAVNPEKCKDAKYELATKFINWMASPEVQAAIGDFKLLGKPLFTPNAK